MPYSSSCLSFSNSSVIIDLTKSGSLDSTMIRMCSCKRDSIRPISSSAVFERSAEVLVELMKPYLQGKITPKAQDDSEATYTKTITREDGFIDINKKSPEEVERFIRAMQPWPGAWTFVRLSEADAQTKRLKIHKAHTDNGKLVLDEVQLEGKDRVTWKQFIDGYKDATFAGEA